MKSLWLCDCGTEATVAHGRVTRGVTASCGCLARERSSQNATKHGGRCSPEYSSWRSMKSRCECATSKDYPHYGGRGITVYPEWSASFEAFLQHLGPRPPGSTLDRIDNAKGYEPSNVRWATLGLQARNRRSSYTWHIRGQIFETAAEAAKTFNVSERSIDFWVNGGFDKRFNTTKAPLPDCWAVPRYPDDMLDAARRELRAKG